ncbi:MAG: hypothetical protein ACOH16_03015 [Propionibacteriaceae bacterium]
MKRAIILTLAAGVATLPALWGVMGNTTFGQSVPASIPSGASVKPSADDSRTTAPAATSTVDDRGSDDSTATSAPTGAATSGDRRGRGSDDATTSSPTRAATVDDKGGSTQGGGDSGGHGGKGGSGKG